MPTLRATAYTDGAAQRLTDGYILLMLLVFPLFTGLQGYAAITVSKFVFFAVATGAWLLGLCLLPLLPVQRAPRARRELCFWLCAAFAALACLSALCSPHRGSTLLGAGRYDGLVTTLLYCGVTLGVQRHAAPRRRYAAALAASMSVCCLIALLQLTGRNPFGLFPDGYTYFDADVRYSGAFLGTIGNVDVLAAYLCCGVGVCCGVWICSERRRDVWLLGPALLGALVLAASRVAAGAVGLAAGALVGAPVLIGSSARLRRACVAGAAVLLGAAGAYGFNALSRRAALLFCAGAAVCLAAAVLCLLLRQPKRLRAVMLALSCAAVLAGLALAWSWPGTDGSLYELSCLLHGHAEDRFGSSRIGIWRRCLRCIAQRPWLGGGPGTAALQLDMTFSRRIAETGVLRTVHVDNAHNVYLGCALDLGLPALGVLLAYLAAAFARWLRGRNQTLRPAFGLGVCACAVQACFGLGLCLTAPVFLILLALTAVPSDRSTEVDPWTTN